jgi:hypothetical protein
MLDQEERKDARQMERRTLEFCKEVEINRRRAESRRKAAVEGVSSYREERGVRAATRSILDGVIAMLTASPASMPEVEGFEAYYSNPVEMYSLLDPEPCPDVALNHLVERFLHC